MYLILLIFFVLGCQQKEKSKKTNRKKGIEQIADYQKQIRKKIDDEESTYKKGYLIEEFNNAKSNLLARGASSSISPVFIERGPNNVPGRSRGIAVDPNNSNRWFVGTVGGGVWLTENGGTTWSALTDFKIPNLATSTIVISQTNSNILYVGTGEPFGNLGAIGGSGLFKTTDGGSTWQHLTTTASLGDVGRIIINPIDDDNVIIATSSGIYNTIDGGITWNQRYNSSGLRVQDLDADPTNFNIQYGSVNELGIIKSVDAGMNWSLVFDRSTFNVNHSRFETSVSPVDSNTLFLSVYSNSGATVGVNTDFYISRDQGASFTNLTTSDTNANLLTGQGWYDNVIMAHPFDANIFYVGGVAVFKVTVSGSTFTSTSIASGYDSSQINSDVHVDQHGIFSIKGTSNNEFRMLLANDGGVYSTSMKEDSGATDGDFSNAVFGKNSTQFYGAAKQNGFDNYLAGAQDNGCWIGLSNNATANKSYQAVFGGDGFEVIWHYNKPQDFIVSSQNNVIGRYVNFSFAGYTSLAGSTIFYTKLANTDNNPDAVFSISGDGVWRSTDFATSWNLTTINSNFTPGAVSSLNVKVSAADPNIVWAGAAMTESGAYVLHVSQDNGQSFTNAEAYNNPNGSHNLYISGLGTSYIEKNRAYALFSAQGVPKILKTEDLGNTWSDITGFEDSISTGFPDVAVHSILEMPFNKDIIWAGTDIGLFQTENGGTSWSIISDFPSVAVYDMKVVNDQIVLATYGRGVWSATISELNTYTLPMYAKIWSGAINTDWANGGNWVAGIIPTESDVVNIPSGPSNQPIIGATTGASVNDLTVEPGASLSVLSGGSLIVKGSSSGTITYHLAIADTNWHLVSSPLIGEEYDDAWVTNNSIAVSQTTSNRAIAIYDNGTPDTDNDGSGADTATGHWRYYTGGSTEQFNTTTGYSTLRTTPGDYTFTGSFPTTDVTSSISRNDQEWNLIGNPYPSYIDIDAFITENSSKLSSAFQAIYVYNGSSYEPINAASPVNYIHPGQAFFVHSNVTTGTVSFTEIMQSHQTETTLYKEDNWFIRLNLFDGTDIKETEINYSNGRTIGLDPGFDIGMFDGTSSNSSVYTRLVEDYQEINFDKQALPNEGLESMIIPIGVKANAGKEIVFSMEVQNLPSGINVFLEDKLTNTFTRLDETDTEYKVTLNEGLNGIGRFYIHTSSQVLKVFNENLLTVSIYTSNNKIHFSGLTDETSKISIYNVLGKLILEENLLKSTTSISTNNLVKGNVYLVHLKTEKGTTTKKIIAQ
jgi:photosystem II stability/assembly factor-like uncharacterized protein